MLLEMIWLRMSEDLPDGTWPKSVDISYLN